MVIYTNSPKVREVRRINVGLILSEHDAKCAVCVRSEIVVYKHNQMIFRNGWYPLRRVAIP